MKENQGARHSIKNVQNLLKLVQNCFKKSQNASKKSQNASKLSKKYQSASKVSKNYFKNVLKHSQKCLTPSPYIPTSIKHVLDTSLIEKPREKHS